MSNGDLLGNQRPALGTNGEFEAVIENFPVVSVVHKEKIFSQVITAGSIWRSGRKTALIKLNMSVEKQILLSEIFPLTLDFFAGGGRHEWRVQMWRKRASLSS